MNKHQVPHAQIKFLKELIDAGAPIIIEPDIYWSNYARALVHKNLIIMGRVEWETRLLDRRRYYVARANPHRLEEAAKFCKQ